MINISLLQVRRDSFEFGAETLPIFQHFYNYLRQQVPFLRHPLVFEIKRGQVLDIKIIIL